MGLAFSFILSIFPVELKRPNKQSTKYELPDIKKNSKLGIIVDQFKWNKFPALPNFKFSMDFE
jgi:hypothetical protein